MVMALIDYLSKSSLFQGLPEHYLNLLAPYLRETFYKRDEYLFREGDMANDLHVITSGQVVLEMRLSNPLRRYQGDIVLTSLSAPHPVAFRALIPHHRYELAARAVLDTVCVSLTAWS
jgi:CRP-like cAMP-binding protein